MNPFASHAESATGTAYDYRFNALADDAALPLSQFRGKVVLIVNTASECGFTPQYKSLQTLYDRYRDRGLVIVGVPSNDFGAQEPGSREQIANFCQVNYGVSFPMTAKVHVRGADAHPFYVWARQRFGLIGSPKWNFHKYLVDRNGRLVNYFHSTTDPLSDRMISAIESLISAQ